MNTSLRIRVLAALLLATAVACGAEESNAPQPGDPLPTGAIVVVDAAQRDSTGEADFVIDFGSIELGQQRAEAFVVRNDGDTAVTISARAIAAPFATDLAETVEVPARGAVSAAVRFTPTEAGTFSSVLELTAGDESFTLRLAGSATAGAIPACVLSIDERPMFWNGTGVGYTHGQVLTLANLGDAPCDAELAVEGEGFAVERTNVSIAARAVEQAIVSFMPEELGIVSGKLRVTSGAREWNVALNGAPVENCIALDAPELKFGIAGPMCSTVQLPVAATNTCPHFAAITDAELAAGASTEFGIRIRPAYPAELAPGAMAHFELVYVPANLGTDEGTFTVHESNGASVAVELEGTGANDRRQVDHFEQGVIPKVDMLVVVDDSAGMQPYVDELAAWATDMRELAIAQRTDVRWGVTTTSRLATDGCEGSGADGRLLPLSATPRWLTVEDSADEWAASLRVGTCSEAPNEGIAAAWRALLELTSVTDDLAHPEADDGNAGFLRPNANLSVVFVSARDDASGESVATWDERLLTIKGERNENMFSAHAIVAPAGGCDAAEHGSRYLELTARRGGIAANLCEPDMWPGSQQGIGTGGFDDGIRTRFFLSNQPEDGDLEGEVEDEIVVRMDGAELPPELAGGGWTYNPDTNSIDFAPEHVPAEGAAFEVEYTVACLPPG